MRKRYDKYGALGVLFVVLLLGLLLAAGPAAAQGSCDCHTAVPPTGGAPAAHAPFVVSVTDCTVCHVGWTVPHPASVTKPVAGAAFNRFTNVLAGFFIGNVGATVYLQQRPWGTIAWSDLTQVTTTADGAIGAQGGMFTYTVPSPTPWAAYRAVCAGAAGTPVILPAKTAWKPTPELTLKLGNVVHGVVPPLGAPVFKGSARPLKLAGENVNLPVYKWRTATKRWVKVRTAKAVISAKGTYAWTFWWSQGYGPGSYRVRASLAATANHRLARTTWRYFKGK